MLPTNLDLIKCIKKCHPDAKINDSDYFDYAKQCLEQVLPASSTSTDEDFQHTSRQYVKYVRHLWNKSKVSRHFNTLLQNKWFKKKLELKSPAPPSSPATPAVPPRPPVTRKLFDEKGPRQQRRDTAKIREENEPSAIVMAAVQYFREIGANDAAHVLKKMKEDPKIGEDLRHFLEDSPEKLPQVSKDKCLAYILDRGMTRIDWEETCKLVNTSGNYRLPCYSSLGVEKQRNRPRGKPLLITLLAKCKLTSRTNLLLFNFKNTIGRKSVVTRCISQVACFFLVNSFLSMMQNVS